MFQPQQLKVQDVEVAVIWNRKKEEEEIWGGENSKCF